MLLLALDTSSAAVTAALHDGDRVVAEVTEHGRQAHGELLAPVVERVLRDAAARPDDLTVLVVGVGPGPFTGLRVGVVTGRTMAYALGCDVHGVCSLDALAWQARAERTVSGPFAVATDARRREVYLATYDATGARLSGPDVLHPADVDRALRDGPVVGEGAAGYPEVFADVREPRFVGAGALASHAAEQLATGRPLLPPEPLYLRRPDVTPATARKSVLPTAAVPS